MGEILADSALGFQNLTDRRGYGGGALVILELRENTLGKVVYAVQEMAASGPKDSWAYSAKGAAI